MLSRLFVYGMILLLASCGGSGSTTTSSSGMTSITVSFGQATAVGVVQTPTSTLPADIYSMSIEALDATGAVIAPAVFANVVSSATAIPVSPYSPLTVPFL